MSVKVANNRFIVSSLRVGFYQQLFKNASSFGELGNRLVKTIEAAQDFRQAEKVEELASFLSNFPLKEYRLIGQYYRGLWLYRKGENSRDIFEKIAEDSSTYRAKALWSLAAIASDKGDYETELKYLTDSLKFASGLNAHIELVKGIAVVKAKEGYHDLALKDLESLVPLLRFAKPRTRSDCLNSLAVEYGEVGRIEEARNVCRIVLASPYSIAYPEWRETGNEVALRGYKSRSVITFKQQKSDTPKSENVFRLPEPKITDTPMKSESGPAPVLSYMEWVEKMVKEPNGEEENLDEMDFNELIVKLLQLTTHEEVSEKKVRKIVKLAIEVIKEKD